MSDTMDRTRFTAIYEYDNEKQIMYVRVGIQKFETVYQYPRKGIVALEGATLSEFFAYIQEEVDKELTLLVSAVPELKLG